ncbi:MAG: siphovirus Gp157 family protein [Oscillospiraceae bacterium]|nr:siphovirus Gp157 family protein [Oscillospiraceae bacterium]
MATIYELTDEYVELLNMLEDPDIDPDVLADTMEGLSGEIEVKADGYAKVIAELNSAIAGLKAEIERLTNRKTTMENNVKYLKSTLQFAMETTGKTKFKTELFSFGIQKNPASVVIDEPYLENIPDKYLIPQDPKIDKVKIKEDLKAGIDIGIAHLEQSQSLRIR